MSFALKSADRSKLSHLGLSTAMVAQLEALLESGDDHKKVYIALLSQASTAAPTAVVISNTLGVTPALARTSAGLYTITATGKFTANLTAISVGNQASALQRIQAVRTSADVVTLTTGVLSVSTGTLITTATDGVLSATLVKIEVFS